MSIKNELGKKIKKLRKSKKLTQEQLAEKINVSPRAISGIELGEYYPKAETLDKILNLFSENRKLSFIIITETGSLLEQPIGCVAIADIMDVNKQLDNFTY